MNPFTIVWLLLKTLYPYLKEAWFRNGQFRNWVKDHKYTLVWLSVKALLLCGMLYMINAIFILTQRLNDYRKANAEYASKYAQLQTTNKALVAEITTLKQERAQRYEQLEYHNRWFKVCNIDEPTQLPLPPCPTPKLPRMVQRPHVTPKPNTPSQPTEPVDTTKRPTLFERLGRIFKREN